jgi:hypothetical protein
MKFKCDCEDILKHKVCVVIEILNKWRSDASMQQDTEM